MWNHRCETMHCCSCRDLTLVQLKTIVALCGMKGRTGTTEVWPPHSSGSSPSSDSSCFTRSGSAPSLSICDRAVSTFKPHRNSSFCARRLWGPLKRRMSKGAQSPCRLVLHGTSAQASSALSQPPASAGPKGCLAPRCLRGSLCAQTRVAAGQDISGVTSRRARPC